LQLQVHLVIDINTAPASQNIGCISATKPKLFTRLKEIICVCQKYTKHIFIVVSTERVVHIEALFSKSLMKSLRHCFIGLTINCVNWWV